MAPFLQPLETAGRGLSTALCNKEGISTFISGYSHLPFSMVSLPFYKDEIHTELDLDTQIDMVVEDMEENSTLFLTSHDGRPGWDCIKCNDSYRTAIGVAIGQPGEIWLVQIGLRKNPSRVTDPPLLPGPQHSSQGQSAQRESAHSGSSARRGSHLARGVPRIRGGGLPQIRLRNWMLCWRVLRAGPGPSRSQTEAVSRASDNLLCRLTISLERSEGERGQGRLEPSIFVRRRIHS